MKPILFNTEMVRAILDGWKTVTRRVVKPQPEGAHTVLDCDEEAHTFALMCGNGGEGGRFVDWAETVKASFWPGDILYVRETWQYACVLDGGDQPMEETGRYYYAADDPCPFNDWVMPDGTHRNHMPWRPSIHMPKEAARIFLRVTGVRVERLQDIDDDGVVAEGMEIGDPFDELWNSTIKPADRPLYGWEANPWVWVIEFERISKEEGAEGRALMDKLKPCRMCDNARVNDELTDSCDLSYISIGDCEKGFRVMLASGDGKPVRIELEHHYSDGLWHLVGIYYPSYCPNCGRKLSEYGAEAWNRRECGE